MFFPLRVSLFYLFQHRVPALFTPQQRSRNLSHRLTLGIKCHGQPLACVCVCMFCFKAVSLCAPWNLTMDSETKRWLEPKRHALWQLLTSPQRRLAGASVQTIQTRLTGFSVNATRPPVSSGSPAHHIQTHTMCCSFVHQWPVAHLIL